MRRVVAQSTVVTSLSTTALHMRGEEKPVEKPEEKPEVSIKGVHQSRVEGGKSIRRVEG